MLIFMYQKFYSTLQIQFLNLDQRRVEVEFSCKKVNRLKLRNNIFWHFHIKKAEMIHERKKTYVGNKMWQSNASKHLSKVENPWLM